MKKRIFSFVLALLTAMVIMPPGVYAEGTDVDVDLDTMYKMQFTVEGVTVDNDDETVSVKISIEKNGGFAALNYQLQFNKDVLSLEEQPVPSSIIESGYMGGPLEEGNHRGMFTSVENVYGDGDILTNNFNINPQAPAGTHEIKLIIDGKASLPNGETINLEVLDENSINITGVVTDGYVTIPGYSVTYDANGGSDAPESVVKSKNVPVIISSKQPKREGFVFLGWATTSLAAEPEYKMGAKYTENADVVLYAVWEKAEVVAGMIDMSVSTVEAKAGDEVEVVIGVANHPGIESMEFDVEFDGTRLKYLSAELVRQENEDITLDEFMFIEPNVETVVDSMTIGLTTGTKNLVGDGDLLKIKFKVLDNAEDGFADVRVIPNIIKKIGGPAMEYQNVVPNIITNGGVEIISQLLGDINVDGVVDMNDAILLLQHSMFPELFPLEYKGSVDFANDGVVDMNDAILLLQHSMFPDLFPLN